MNISVVITKERRTKLNLDTLLPGSRIELGFLQVDIVGRSKFVESDKAIHRAKAIFRGLVEGIVTSRDGKVLNWAGEGGSFMFIISDNEGLSDMVFSGFQILHSLPIINDEIAAKSRFGETFSVRISADTGTVLYNRDPGQISGDVLTRFLESERELGIAGTFSITGRVWRQLERSLKTKFVLWKHSQAARDDIYNYGIRQKQTEILSSLKNIDLYSEEERPYAGPECVEIITIKGDRLADLARHAYRDVILEGYSNVGGQNLMVIKNAQVCSSFIEQFRADSDFLSHEDIEREFPELSREYRKTLLALLGKMNAVDCQETLSLFKRIPFSEMEETLEYSSKDTNVGPEKVIERLRRIATHSHSNFQVDPLEELKGGETLRFYNCTALGFAPEIGVDTLVDNVIAGNLNISHVIGGVEEPALEQRFFRLVDGNYEEIDSEQRSRPNSGAVKTMTYWVEIEIVNPTDADRVFTIPKGRMISPKDLKDKAPNLAVLKDTRVKVPAKGKAIVTVLTDCTDPDLPAPNKTEMDVTVFGQKQRQNIAVLPCRKMQ